MVYLGRGFGGERRGISPVKIKKEVRIHE